MPKLTVTPKTTPVTFRADVEMVDKLETLATKLNTTPSAIVYQVLSAYLSSSIGNASETLQIEMDMNHTKNVMLRSLKRSADKYKKTAETINQLSFLLEERLSNGNKT